LWERSALQRTQRSFLSTKSKAERVFDLALAILLQNDDRGSAAGL
jgi:hypothetical protein